MTWIWNFSKVWNRPWFFKTFIFRNLGAYSKAVLLTIRSYFFFFFPSVHSANAIYKSAFCFVLDLGQIQWKIQGSFCLKKESIRRWLSKNSFEFPLLKLEYCKKATKFEKKISHLFWCFPSNVKKVGDFFKYMWPFQKSEL